MRFAVSIVILIFTATMSFAAETPATQPATQPSPDPKYSPADVVKIQLAAMQHNNDPEPDAGIATAFRFASPGNQQKTGPLDRFIKMVRTPAYQPMLDFKSADYAPTKMTDAEAQQLVKITDANGQSAIYVFILTRQTDGPYKDCWMTDGVVPLRPQQPNPPDDKPREPPIKT